MEFWYLSWRQIISYMVFVAATIAAMIFYIWPWYGLNIPVPNVLAFKESTSPAWEKALVHIEEAELQAKEALKKRLGDISRFFDSRCNAGARPFAADVLSLRGKWVLMKNAIGLDRDLARFLANEFSKHLFTPDDLRDLLESVVAGYLADLDLIENELLLRIRADLSEDDLARGKVAFSLQSDEIFRQEIGHIATELKPSLGIDTAVLTGRVLATTVGPANVLAGAASTVVTRVAGAVAAEAGISTTFYGAGAVSGAASLGVGLGVMILLDKIIERILMACGYNAEANLASEIRKAIDGTKKLILEGTPGALRDYRDIVNMARTEGEPWVRDAARKAIARLERGGHLGLVWELEHQTEARSRLLRASLRKLLTGGAS